jgi:hypothetical protein
MAIETSAGHAEMALTEVIAEIIGKIKELKKEYRWSELPPLGAELEKQLRLLPRRGSQVREGWILLAQIEDQRLHSAQMAGRAVDVSRLRALREEAKNVVV